MRYVVLFLTGVICAGAAMAAGEWPDWRGPTANGQTASGGLPLHWSETEHVAWKAPIHDLGHSTPVVWGGQVWITTARQDGTAVYAMGFDAATGQVLHDVLVFSPENPQRINPLNSYATPSPCIEAGRVYVHYGDLGTACLDTDSGAVLWRREDLRCEHMQGPASSPALYEDLLIVHLEGTDRQYIVGLDKATGETVWRHDRPRDLYQGLQPVYYKSYQTPVFLDIDGKTQMISNGALLATGHDPRTGEELWRVRYQHDSTISRIIAGEGLLFINTGGPPGGTHLYAVRTGGTGDVTDTHVAWKMTEDAPHESSPVLVDGLLYTMSDQGVFFCLEAKTGQVVWKERLRGKFSASLLAAPGRIYFSSKNGVTTVIAPGREYRELAVNELDGELWSSPAVAGDALFLRTKTYLYRIED